MASNKYGREHYDLAGVLERLGMSQRQLAKQLGRTQDWVGRIRNAKSLPSWETVCRIADCLGLSIGAFRPGDPAHDALMRPAPAEDTSDVYAKANGGASTKDSRAIPRPRPRKRVAG